MHTNHFNRLTTSEQERLAILIEECGEVVQAACKILRHGYESTNPDGANSETNRFALEHELGHVTHAITRMEEAGDLNMLSIRAAAASKAKSIIPYLHHTQPD